MDTTESLEKKRIVSSSYYWPVSISQRRAHIRAVVLQNLHRGLRNTRLCPYWVTCNILGLSVFPTTLLFSTRPDLPPRLLTSHVCISPPDSFQKNALTLPHRLCPRAPDLSFLRRSSGSTWFWGFLSLSATVNLHWPPDSDGSHPMPVWQSLTLSDWAPRHLRTHSSNCATGSTWKLGYRIVYQRNSLINYRWYGRCCLWNNFVGAVV